MNKRETVEKVRGLVRLEEKPGQKLNLEELRNRLAQELTEAGIEARSIGLFLVVEGTAIEFKRYKDRISVLPVRG